MRFPKTKRDFEIDVMKAYCDGFMTACKKSIPASVWNWRRKCHCGFSYPQTALNTVETDTNIRHICLTTNKEKEI